MSSPNYQGPSSSSRKAKVPLKWTQILNEALQAKQFTQYQWELHKFNDNGREMHVATFHFNRSHSFTSQAHPNVRDAREEAAGFALPEVNKQLALLNYGYHK